MDLFLESHSHPPRQIILDLGATDDPVHGRQEGRFFHGYYGHYCYLPLCVFRGEHLLPARLIRKLSRSMKQARRRFGRTGQAARVFHAFRYRTRKSWRRSRHVVGETEYLPKGANPRFVVTTLDEVPP